MGKWVATLDAARKLGAKIVGTGHGPRSDAQVLDDQQAFFKAMRDEVGALMAAKAPEDAKAQVESVRAALKGNAQIARFVGERGTGWDPFPAQVEKVYQELTGKKLAALMREPQRSAFAWDPDPTRSAALTLRVAAKRSICFAAR